MALACVRYWELSGCDAEMRTIATTSNATAIAVTASSSVAMRSRRRSRLVMRASTASAARGRRAVSDGDFGELVALVVELAVEPGVRGGDLAEVAAEAVSHRFHGPAVGFFAGGFGLEELVGHRQQAGGVGKEFDELRDCFRPHRMIVERSRVERTTSALVARLRRR